MTPQEMIRAVKKAAAGAGLNVKGSERHVSIYGEDDAVVVLLDADGADWKPRAFHAHGRQCDRMEWPTDPAAFVAECRRRLS